LGVQLFERGHRRIEPTNAGRIFLQRARDLMDRHAQLEKEMGLVRPGEHASVSLAVGPYVAELIAAPAIANAAREYPGAQFRLHVEGWAEAIRSNQARACAGSRFGGRRLQPTG
jgi:DNA-binding transcriptional LysR family regulator